VTFREILAEIVDATPGALAGAIMGCDGIPVEEYHREPGGVDLDMLVVEFQLVVEQARKVASALYHDPASGLEELILRTSTHQILFRQIDAEYFLVVVLDPGGILGKARYLTRAVLEQIRSAL
jgi:predicted regulator of Ras-like GTPase activity (Roadblock/LC7/MglB family)